MGDYVIEANGLCKSFGSKRALSDFSLRIEKGGVHAIIGSNGAGKSTLFRVLLGFLTPSAGASFVLGETSLRLSPGTRGAVCYVNPFISSIGKSGAFIDFTGTRERTG